MRKLLASLAFAAALAIGSSAHAAAVEINLTQDALGSSSWTLTVDLASGQTLGALSILTEGLNSFTLNTSLVGVSAPDSVYSIDPLGTGQNALIVNNSAIGVALGGGPGPLSLLIGSFVGGTNSPPVFILDGTDVAGGSAFDANGNVITDFALHTHPVTAPVPEPLSAMLMGLGLASLALARRKA